MKENIFWDISLSKRAIAKILKDERNARFVDYAATLLSRTSNIKLVFSEYLDKVTFCRNWRRISARMRKNKWSDRRIIFWREVYRAVLHDLGPGKIHPFKEKKKPVSPEIKKIGGIIRQARKEKGMTQKDLAKATGLSQQILSYAEKGYLNFSFDTLQKIARPLGLEIYLTPKKTHPPEY